MDGLTLCQESLSSEHSPPADSRTRLFTAQLRCLCYNHCVAPKKWLDFIIVICVYVCLIKRESSLGADSTLCSLPDAIKTRGFKHKSCSVIACQVDHGCMYAWKNERTMVSVSKLLSSITKEMRLVGCDSFLMNPCSLPEITIFPSLVISHLCNNPFYIFFQEFGIVKSVCVLFCFVFFWKVR